MKQRFPLLRRLTRPCSAFLICALLLSGPAWGIVVVPPANMIPLAQVPVPEPPTLFQFVKNKFAAIRLGKALFWEMQTGSDGIQACATCHHKAGVDKRLKNTLSPGPDSVFGNNAIGVPGFPQFAPNYTLLQTDFPLLRHQNPEIQSLIIQATNDIVGSQGVRRFDFQGILTGQASEIGASVLDPVFNLDYPSAFDPARNTRRVTGRNTPGNINAIFNFNNFWDGRAYFLFNGENPFGPADQNAGVWFDVNGVLTKQPVTIEFASLASQAVGPPLNDTEMSFRGRTFPELGRKLLSLVPLGKQLVHPVDSVLGALSRATVQLDGTISDVKGLNTTYSQMIQDAFQNNLWNSAHTATINTVNGPVQFSQMEANFSLFWGLAIQLYEATLISDQTRFDQFVGGATTVLTDQEKLGFNVFLGVGNCVACHVGSELTSHSVRNIAFVNNAANGTIELMFVADGTQVIYDEGFINTSVTPTADDIGRGGNMPFTNPLTGLPFPLSFSRLAELQALGQLPFAAPVLPVVIPGPIPGSLPPNFPVSADGLLKVPGLRNVELTAPFFHNGSVMTLDDVVDFYVRGGNFPLNNIANLDPAIFSGIPQLLGDAVRQAALVAFLKTLTDQRVVNEAAPFDHPELFIPEGDPEVLTRIAARDANGVAAQTGALVINAVVSPTGITSQTISGSVISGAPVNVSVNGGAPVAAIMTGTSWTATISLAQGTNTITASAVIGGVITTATATIVLDTIPPSLTLNPVTTPTTLLRQALSGTTELGATVRVSVNGGASAPATVTGTAWSFNASLITGTNSIVVTAADASGNTTTLTASISVVSPFSISGTVTTGGVGQSGVTLTLKAGAVTVATAVTSSFGAYTFTGVLPGAYTVTPSLAGFIYTPTSAAVTVGPSAVNVNFAGARAFTLSGTVKNSVTGAAVAGVTVNLGGARTGTTSTDALGNYSFQAPNGLYTVTPSKAGFKFSPISLSVTISNANKTGQNFRATPVFTISGTITHAGGAPFGGVTVVLGGTATKTTTTDAFGHYSFTGLINGSYSVLPRKTGSLFTPAFRSVRINNADVTGQNFTGTP